MVHWFWLQRLVYVTASRKKTLRKDTNNGTIVPESTILDPQPSLCGILKGPKQLNVALRHFSHSPIRRALVQTQYIVPGLPAVS